MKKTSMDLSIETLVTIQLSTDLLTRKDIDILKHCPVVIKVRYGYCRFYYFLNLLFHRIFQYNQIQNSRKGPRNRGPTI